MVNKDMADRMDYNNCLIISSFPNEDDKVNGSTNKPKIRHKQILDTIRDKYSFYIPKQTLTTKIIADLNVHCADYLDFLENAWISFNENYDKDFDPNNDRGLVPYHFCINRENKGYRKIPHVWKRAGYFCHDVTTPIYENTFKIAMMSANNSFIASKMIDNYNLIYCLNSYPSHHAQYNSYGGYCYLNNTGICAKQYLQTHPNNKIAILDIDYHFGNACQDLFYTDNKVYTISIHGDPVFDYPTFSGFDDEVGEGPGEGFNKNLIFSKGVKSEEYIELLNIAIHEINNYDPQLVIVNFGGDTYKEDKDASNLYGASLELEDFNEIGKELKKINKKIIISQEGGYCMEKIGTIVDNFLSGLI